MRRWQLGKLNLSEGAGAGYNPARDVPRMPNLSGLEVWSLICGSEIASAHAATYPSRASEYGPYMREFLAAGSRVTPQQLTAARNRREAFTAGFTAVLELRIHHADESGRGARDLCAVRLFCGRSAV